MCAPAVHKESHLDHKREEMGGMNESNFINPDNSKVKGMNYVKKKKYYRSNLLLGGYANRFKTAATVAEVLEEQK